MEEDNNQNEDNDENPIIIEENQNEVPFPLESTLPSMESDDPILPALPARVDRLFEPFPNPSPPDFTQNVSEIKLDENLYSFEKKIYSYLYSLFLLSYDYDFKKKATFFTYLFKSGLFYVLILIFQFLQLLSLEMPPSLVWSYPSQLFSSLFTFLRTFQLEYLLSSYSLSVQVGEWLNYYLPFCFSVIYTLILYTFFFLSLKIRQKYFIKFFRFLLTLNQFFYLPILSGFLNTIVCYNCSITKIVCVSNCFDLNHFIFGLISIVFIPFYILFSGFFLVFFYEWRPVQDLSSSPHRRFSIIFFIILTFLQFLTIFLELYGVFLLFIDFFLILVLVCSHIYFLQWFNQTLNQLVCSILFVCLFGNMTAILLSSFKLMLPFIIHSFTIFPGLMFISSIILGTIIGTLLTQLRFRVIGLTVNSLTAPRIFQILYRLQPDEIVVPKGDFEVEMAAKTVGVFNLNVDKLNTAENEIELENEISSENDENFDDIINSSKTRRHASRKLIERVHTLYTNSLDVGMAYSDYISLSYSLIHAFVMKDLKRAISILIQAKQDKKGGLLLNYWADIKFMFYIRLRYFCSIEKELEKVREQENLNRQEIRRQMIEESNIIENENT